HSEEELQQILIHESTHVRQWHSADVLLGELLSVFFWWNPAVWLLKREIVINLEYLADNDVLQHGVNSREYQYHLLKLTYHETAVPLSNHFNVSQLKQRITMMNKTQSSAVKLAKYLTVIPLVLLLITLNSCLSKEKQTDEKSNDQTEELQNSSSKNDIKADVSEGYVPPVTDSQEEIFSVVE
ncbi:MAG TPA: M56 family peptidase, partial [Porphyromonadaceae bacterium]|nr:M56 family peptidase [Porphyromonadaceae bacterium]